MPGRKELVYQLYRQDISAPLIFVQGGVGANIFSGTSSFVAELLWRTGFHVIVLPSPLNWNFTYNASQSAAPGVTKNDAEDICRVMRMSLEASKKLYEIKVTKTGAVGISLGALELAYISELENERHQLGIESYLLINPPIKLRYAADQIDQLKAKGKNWSEEKKQRLIGYAYNKILEIWKENSNSKTYLKNISQRFKLDNDEIKYLIGYAMESTIGDVIYIDELVNKQGILKAPLEVGHLSAREEEAAQFTLGVYLDRILLPMWHNKGQDVSIIAEFDANADLIPALKKLAKNNNIFVFHNEDDFLVTSSQLAVLQDMLGPRLHLFPYGGHMGNVWFKDNRDLISLGFNSPPLGAKAD